MPPLSGGLRKILSRLYVVLVLGFFVNALTAHPLELAKIGKLNPYFFSFGVLMLFAFRVWGVLVWRIILTSLGSANLPAFSDMSFVYAKAWMGRYIPGSVAWVAGKVVLGSQAGISTSRLIASSVLESGMQIVAMLAGAIIFLSLDQRLETILGDSYFLFGISGILIGSMVYPPIFNALLRLSFTLLKKRTPSDELQINFKAFYRSLALYLIGSLLAGAANFLVIKSYSANVKTSDLFFIIGAFNLASAAGMAAIFAPGGIGVRDGIQLLFLKTILPAESSILIVVLLRILGILLDFLFLLFTWAVHFSSKRRANTAIA
jgi:hypothetical protein